MNHDQQNNMQLQNYAAYLNLPYSIFTLSSFQNLNSAIS